MAMLRRLLSVQIIILVAFLARNIQGDVSTTQACNFAVSIASSEIVQKYEDIYRMVNVIYDKLQNDLSTGNRESKESKVDLHQVSRTCQRVSDNELRDILQQRTDKRNEKIRELDSRYNRLHLRHQEIGRRYMKYRNSVDQAQRKYKTCKTARIQLAENITELTTYATGLERSNRLALAELNTKSTDLHRLELHDKACQQRFSEVRGILSQMLGPSPGDNYWLSVDAATDAEMKELEQKVSDFTDRIREKENVTNTLSEQLEQLQRENADLRLRLEQQSQENELKYGGCIEELNVWKEILKEKSAETNQSTTYSCVNGNISLHIL